MSFSAAEAELVLEAGPLLSRCFSGIEDLDGYWDVVSQPHPFEYNTTPTCPNLGSHRVVEEGRPQADWFLHLFPVI